LDFDFVRRAVLLVRGNEQVIVAMFDDLARRVVATHNFFVVYYDGVDEADFQKLQNIRVVLEQDAPTVSGELLYIYVNGNYLSFNDTTIYIVDPRIVCYHYDFVAREQDLIKQGYTVNVWNRYKELRDTLGYVMEFRKDQVDVLYPRTQQLFKVTYDDFWYLDEVARDVMMSSVTDVVEFKVYRLNSEIQRLLYVGPLYINGKWVNPDSDGKWYLERGKDYFIVSQDAKVLRTKLGKIEYGLPLKRIYVR